jgi:two-component sensor histidine kinase
VAEASSLRTIIESELEPFGSRVFVDADDIPLSPEAAQDFGLILHELATNAVKHGSLSVPSGKVRLAAKREGSTEAPRFVFDWREEDGPPVRPSQRKGFGSVVLEGTPRRFCDVIQAAFLPTGLHYRLEGRLGDILPSIQAIGVRHQSGAR